MADGTVALRDDVQQNLANLAAAAAKSDSGAALSMVWDGTNLKWQGAAITSWPTAIGASQIVHLTGFTTVDKVPSWVPLKGNPNIQVLLPATTGVATLDSSGHVTSPVPVASLLSGSATAGQVPVADGKGGFTMQTPAASTVTATQTNTPGIYQIG